MKPDSREIITAQIRAIQHRHPTSHSKMQNWAAWSRAIEKVPGLTNHLQPPGLWSLAQPSKWDDWADEDVEEVKAAVEKPEKREKEEFDSKAGETLDRLIHAKNFPAQWRRIAKVAYFWQMLEYQCPLSCRLSEMGYMQALDGMLGFIGE